MPFSEQCFCVLALVCAEQWLLAGLERLDVSVA